MTPEDRRPATDNPGPALRVAVVGPVYPYRAGIAYCTTRLAEELSKRHPVALVSFRRQFPKLFYPGGDDVDPTLVDRTPPAARFELDVVNPWTWWREGKRLARGNPDVVIFVWWIWIWALPYLVMRRMLPRSTRVVFQCHNVGHKEPAAWKSWLTDLLLRSGDLLVVHARSERDEAIRRLGAGAASKIEQLFLPVHELGGAVPSRDDARSNRGLPEGNVALFFGHVRPFKGLDLALRAWSLMKTDALLVVAGEIWFNAEERYRGLARELGVADRVRFETRFIPDDEIADWFAAADVVVAPYRSEAQSGVALTAFHFARPVIATRVGGIPEAIEDGREGLLVSPENPEALANALDDFFTRRDRGMMERAAADRAIAWSWPGYVDRLAGMLGRAPSST